ncbi:unnamed protein product [Paramecium sonneborni]|uniref:Uncharacterized protein n=1 Tax=Paramecium sonneborni TaxID=65129 RepID=A0A8S1MAB8_9CILI|nr:unnamed protein product [Paramecium sonneborni]
MNEDFEQIEDNQTDSNLMLNKQRTLSNYQQDSEFATRVITNQSESNQKKQSIILIDHSEHQDFQEQQNYFKLDKNVEKKGLEHKNIRFLSQQKKSSQIEKFYHSQTRIQIQDDSSYQNHYCNSYMQSLKKYNQLKSNDYQNISAGHDDYNSDNVDELQEQRKQKIRELELQIQVAQIEIDEQDEKIKLNKGMITTFENFMLKDYNYEEFKKILQSDSNFKTDNILITHLINKLKQLLQEFQNSIIDRIDRFDGKTEFEKDYNGDQNRNSKVNDQPLDIITREFQIFSQQQQQQIDIQDNKDQIINQDFLLTNNNLNSLILSINDQTKLLRDVLQKSCCLIIKFNCEIYNGLQGMSKNKNQLEQIGDLTKSVKQIIQQIQSIINQQLDLQQISTENDQILLLDLLKQLINKQEKAKQFQKLFEQLIFQRIDLVQQSEENLREEMVKRLQSFN